MTEVFHKHGPPEIELNSTKKEATGHNYYCRTDRMTITVADLDDSDQKPFLLFLVHGAGDGTDRPTQGVEVVPRELAPRDLEEMGNRTRNANKRWQ